MKHDIVILGAGPTGLGAGHRLHNDNRKSWKIFEASSRVGGLSSSRLDKNGFTWDLGGHVLFSKSAFFNSLVEKTLGDEALVHKRDSYIKMNGRLVPFPLQYNIHRLPKKVMEDCLAGLVEVSRNGTGNRPPENFEQWIPARLGRGIAKHFMLPYNKKLWSYPLGEMGFGWVGERVALPPVAAVKRSIKTGKDQTGWGGNADFRFPLRGGTGGLMDGLARPFRKKIAFLHEAKKIDPKTKRITFQNGKRASYKSLITTMPLDHLIKNVLINPPPGVLRAAGELRYNSGWIVGIGINREIKGRRCWVYFPDKRVPFYRVTYFSHYSPCNVPKPESQASFLCETSFHPSENLTGAEVAKKTIDGLVSARFIRREEVKNIASQWKIKIPRLYPIPAQNRDAALKAINAYLKKRDIRSVGRFGGWRYEIGNVDHSFLAGHHLAGGGDMLAQKPDAT